MENKQQYIVTDLMLTSLSEDEMNVVNIIKKGEPIAGKQMTDKAVFEYVNMRITDRTTNN